MNREEKKCLRIKRLIENLTEIDNIGKKTRKRQYADLRKIYCKLCAEYTEASLTKIGDTLRIGYGHANVIYNIKKFDELEPSGGLLDIKVYDEVGEMIKNAVNVIDRYDIYNNLPHGALSYISDKKGCSLVQVKRILEGERKDNYGIIKEAELLAAKYIWQMRYCRRAKSKIKLFE